MTKGRHRQKLCVLGLACCGVVLFLHVWLGNFACSTDTSNCALGHVKNGVFRGVLADRDGRPLTATPFSVGFPSREGMRDAGGFSTDAAGRYCIVWAQDDRVTLFAHVSGATFPLTAAWAPLNGAAPPRGCQSGDQGIPWNRAGDLRDSTQYESVIAALIAAMAVLGFALGYSATGRLDKAGIGLTVAATAYAAVVWFA